MSALIHCNICFKLPDPRAKFFINNCGHMACYGCVKAGKMKPKCHLCNQKTQMRLIAPGMKGFDMFKCPMKTIDDLIEKAERQVVCLRQSTPYPSDKQEDPDKRFHCESCAQSFDEKLALIEHYNGTQCGGSNNESGESTEVDDDSTSSVKGELMDEMSQNDQESLKWSQETNSQVEIKNSTIEQLNEDEDESRVVESFSNGNSQLQRPEPKQDSQEEQIE